LGWGHVDVGIDHDHDLGRMLADMRPKGGARLAAVLLHRHDDAEGDARGRTATFSSVGNCSRMRVAEDRFRLVLAPLRPVYGTS
jgi:hypothetical protein